MYTYAAGSPGTFKGMGSSMYYAAGAVASRPTSGYDGLYYAAGAIASRPDRLGDYVQMGAYGETDPAAYQAFRAGGMTHEQAMAAAEKEPPAEDWSKVIAATIGATSDIIGASLQAKTIKQQQHELERQRAREAEAAAAAARGNAMILSSVQRGYGPPAAPPGQMAKLALPIGIGVALLAGVFLLRR